VNMGPKLNDLPKRGQVPGGQPRISTPASCSINLITST
jgi:hypothetical protein